LSTTITAEGIAVPMFAWVARRIAAVDQEMAAMTAYEAFLRSLTAGDLESAKAWWRHVARTCRADR